MDYRSRGGHFHCYGFFDDGHDRIPKKEKKTKRNAQCSLLQILWTATN